MISFNPQNENFDRVVRDSFAAQRIMATLGAELTAVLPGRVEIRLPFQTDWTQQHGFLHAGIVTTILDSACGYAALSLMPQNVGVLSIEFKTNFLAPARGDLLVARAEVVRSGRTISVCKADGSMTADGEETAVATMLATIMTVRDRPGVVG